MEVFDDIADLVEGLDYRMDTMMQAIVPVRHQMGKTVQAVMKFDLDNFAVAVAVAVAVVAAVAVAVAEHYRYIRNIVVAVVAVDSSEVEVKKMMVAHCSWRYPMQDPVVMPVTEILLT